MPNRRSSKRNLNCVTFGSLCIGDTFDFIDEKNPTHNSFYARCIKTSTRKYEGIDTGNKYRVGSVHACVYHVKYLRDVER